MKKAEDANAYYNKQPAKMNVYDAGESVKDMPIKKTEESHKKCSPGEFGMHKSGNYYLHRKSTMTAFQFGQMMKLALDNDAFKLNKTPGATYPYAPNVNQHPEYAPNTPNEPGMAEAAIPPRVFPRDSHEIGRGMDSSDNLGNVFLRQQMGQGMYNSGAGTSAAQFNANMAKRIQQERAFERSTGGPTPAAKPLPEGQPRPPVVQPPRGLGSAGR